MSDERNIEEQDEVEAHRIVLYGNAEGDEARVLANEEGDEVEAHGKVLFANDDSDNRAELFANGDEQGEQGQRDRFF